MCVCVYVYVCLYVCVCVWVWGVHISHSYRPQGHKGPTAPGGPGASLVIQRPLCFWAWGLWGSQGHRGNPLPLGDLWAL